MRCSRRARLRVSAAWGPDAWVIETPGFGGRGAPRHQIRSVGMSDDPALRVTAILHLSRPLSGSGTKSFRAPRSVCPGAPVAQPRLSAGRTVVAPALAPGVRNRRPGTGDPVHPPAQAPLPAPRRTAPDAFPPWTRRQDRGTGGEGCQGNYSYKAFDLLSGSSRTAPFPEARSGVRDPGLQCRGTGPAPKTAARF